MFQKGEYVVYGTKGPCLIADITKLCLNGKNSERIYYVMHPVSSPKSVIYTPVDNEKVEIRSIMTNEEAERLIEEIPSIEKMQIRSERLREDQYREVIKGVDLRACISMVKTLLSKRKIRLEQGRKFTTVDERYLKEAEEQLFDELSISLSKPKEAVIASFRTIVNETL
ncbi:MAG: CarD family transcriptional regulator [Eubacterium sp.]|nr:CarD family transcriptional regulator [Eubacterium sp.]